MVLSALKPENRGPNPNKSLMRWATKIASEIFVGARNNSTDFGVKIKKQWNPHVFIQPFIGAKTPCYSIYNIGAHLVWGCWCQRFLEFLKKTYAADGLFGSVDISKMISKPVDWFNRRMFMCFFSGWNFNNANLKRITRQQHTPNQFLEIQLLSHFQGGAVSTCNVTNRWHCVVNNYLIEVSLWRIPASELLLLPRCCKKNLITCHKVTCRHPLTPPEVFHVFLDPKNPTWKTPFLFPCRFYFDYEEKTTPRVGSTMLTLRSSQPYILSSIYLSHLKDFFCWDENRVFKASSLIRFPRSYFCLLRWCLETKPVFFFFNHCSSFFFVWVPLVTLSKPKLDPQAMSQCKRTCSSGRFIFPTTPESTRITIQQYTTP